MHCCTIANAQQKQGFFCGKTGEILIFLPKTEEEKTGTDIAVNKVKLSTGDHSYRLRVCRRNI